MRENEILKTIDDFYAQVKAIDPEFVLKKGMETFEIEKTVGNKTGKISISLLDPPSWRYGNRELSCKGFIIEASQAYSRHDGRKNPRILENNLGRFSEILPDLIEKVNGSINYQLTKNINECDCETRFDNEKKHVHENWLKTLENLGLPYYKPSFYSMREYETEREGKVYLKFERKLTLNHPKFDPVISSIDETQLKTISKLIFDNISQLKEFSIISNAEKNPQSFDLRLKWISASLFKDVISIIRQDLKFKVDAID